MKIMMLSLVIIGSFVSYCRPMDVAEENFNEKQQVHSLQKWCLNTIFNQIKLANNPLKKTAAHYLIIVNNAIYALNFSETDRLFFHCFFTDKLNMKDDQAKEELFQKIEKSPVQQKIKYFDIDKACIFIKPTHQTKSSDK